MATPARAEGCAIGAVTGSIPSWWPEGVTPTTSLAHRDGGRRRRQLGKLRRELGMLPAGDFRNCIAALSATAEGLVSQLFSTVSARTGGLDGHSFGNLYLTAMTAITGGFVSALESRAGIGCARGASSPSTLAQVIPLRRVMAASPGAGAAPGAVTAAAGRVTGSASLREPGPGGSTWNPRDAPAYPEAIRANSGCRPDRNRPGKPLHECNAEPASAGSGTAVSSSMATKAYVGT